MESVNFDRGADNYDATRSFPDGVAEQVGQFITDSANLSTNDTILEIGIGTGRISLPLAPYVKFIAGADISLEMMKILIDKRQNKAVFPTLADGHDLPYRNNSFDAVMIVQVLHLVPDPSAMLKDIQRVMKQNGKLLHCVNQREDDSSPLALAWRSERPKRKYGHNWETTSTALENSGLRLESEDVFSYSHTGTPRAFLYPIESQAWSSTWDVDEEELARGIKAIKTAIAEHYDNDYDAKFEQTSQFIMQVYRTA